MVILCRSRSLRIEDLSDLPARTTDAVAIRRMVLLSLLLSLIAGSAGCDGSDDDNASEVTASQAAEPVPPPILSKQKSLGLSRCHGTGPGGYNVYVAGIPCERVRQIFDRFGLAPVGTKPERQGHHDANDPQRQEVFDRGNGWTCWARLGYHDGVISNVCWRGDAVVVYSFA